VQGTVALEFLEQTRELLLGESLDCLIVPIGGGGLISGIAMVVKTLHPDILVIAAEPANAQDAYLSKIANHIVLHSTPPQTIADGLKTCLGSNTWPIIRDLVDMVITVEEEEIKQAVRLVWQHMKLVIEPSAGVGIAVALTPSFQALGKEKVGVVLCGGNIDKDGILEVFA
jgi:threonine dehydratase